MSAFELGSLVASFFAAGIKGLQKLLNGGILYVAPGAFFLMLGAGLMSGLAGDEEEEEG